MGIFDFLNRSAKEILEECEVHRSRGSGPGGQKADRSETAVKLVHRPTGCMASSEKTRSQHKNRQLALRKLKRNYSLEKRHKIPPDKFTMPSSLQQYVNNGLRIKTGNPHYPFLIKLVLDVLYSVDGRLSEASDVLGVSTNQLVEFLKDEGAVHEWANKIRTRHGHHRLK